MIRDNKDWVETQVEQIEEMAVKLAESDHYHYFEDFLDRLIITTQAIEIFSDRQSVEEYFRPIWKEFYSSIGGV